MVVLVCAAHPDDEIIGCGGLIAKYSKREKVIVAIFSYGTSRTWQKIMQPGKGLSKGKIMDMRKKECRDAAKIVGVSKTYFLGADDLRILDHKDIAKRKIKALIKRYKPKTIVYHSKNDTHIDHLAVNKIMSSVIKELKYKPTILTYKIGLAISTSKGNKILIDITDSFDKKLLALKKFKSQRKALNFFIFLIRLKCLINGLKSGCRYAEGFYEE